MLLRMHAFGPPPLPLLARQTLVGFDSFSIDDLDIRGGKLMMCPEPVAPGYEYSDVFEEVVKLHPPVGQLILEDIERWVRQCRR